MKTKGRRQSTNVVTQDWTPKDQALKNQRYKMNSERTLSSEPIAYNQDSPRDEFLETMQGKNNPANTLKAKDREVNPSDFQFFKHTIKDNK